MWLTDKTAGDRCTKRLFIIDNLRATVDFQVTEADTELLTPLVGFWKSGIYTSHTTCGLASST
jgi:hypothetical protein